MAVDDLSSNSSDYAANSWVTWFLSTKGNEYFCEVDEDYILDRFNLTGLNGEVQHYPQALDLVTDALGELWGPDSSIPRNSAEHVCEQKTIWTMRRETTSRRKLGCCTASSMPGTSSRHADSQRW